jgi:catechol-2,3-dioxygenase
MLSDSIALDHVQIAAPPGCEHEARRFFGDLFGLEELPKPVSIARRGGVWFRVGQQQLHIGVEGEFAPAKKAHPAFRLASTNAVNSLARRLSEAEQPVDWDDSIPNILRFYTEDPWGNRIEVLTSI